MAKSYKHLDLSARIEIERLLDAGVNLSGVAERIGVSPQTVAREVRRNAKDSAASKPFGISAHPCARVRYCKMRGICEVCRVGGRPYCKNCRSVNCTGSCPDFCSGCPRLSRSPHVCNACPSQRTCRLTKRWYKAKVAQEMSEVALHESRQGIDLTYGELEVMEAKTAPLLKQGLSPYVIYRTIGDELPVLERSFYRYVEKHYLAGIRATDLPEKMKRRPRRHGKKASSRTNIAKEELSGRTYADFMALPEGVKALAVEGDCVCGIKSDSKVLLTLFWRSSSVQLMLPMGRQDSDHVKAQFDILERILGDDFPAVILLDRGSEFARASALETSCLNEGKRCHVYYCDPMRADQKGACERNHRFIRRIIPKGTSLERISRRDAARLMSHVNSLPRRSLGGISPIAAARDILPQALFEAYGIEEIKVAQIVLKPSLIGL